MQKFSLHRVSRMGACRADLMENGIDLWAMDARRLEAFVDEHLGYFQVMLGDDSSAAEILALAGHERRVSEEAGQKLAACRSDEDLDLAGRLDRAERRREVMADMSLEELIVAATELRRRSAEVMEQIEAVQERFEALHL